MNKLFDEYLETLSTRLSILPDKQEETPLNTLRALWFSAAGVSVSAIKSEFYELPELSNDEYHQLRELIRKRLENVPLAHLTGKQSFLDMDFHAGPEALIPRKETELLALTAINILKDMDAQQVNVIDVCTGAGNVAIAIAHSIEKAMVFASDISDGAIKLAKRNAKLHKLSSKVSFYCGDLLQPFDKMGLKSKVDLLCCNPPYISSSKVSEMPCEISGYEPGEAFDGGAFGVNLICRLITDAEKYLRPKGYLAFEVGIGQGAAMLKYFNKTGSYYGTRMLNDGFGNPRVIVAQKI